MFLACDILHICMIYIIYTPMYFKNTCSCFYVQLYFCAYIPVYTCQKVSHIHVCSKINIATGAHSAVTEMPK